MLLMGTEAGLWDGGTPRVGAAMPADACTLAFCLVAEISFSLFFPTLQEMQTLRSC